ncbi:MAG: hypothetical protein WKG01_28085 [Kofleriaceae bacterium]
MQIQAVVVIALAALTLDAHAAGTTTAPGGDRGPDAKVRAQLDRLPSMQGEYINPCYADDAITFSKSALHKSDGGGAHRALERYRNVLSCKHIKVDQVPAADLEDDVNLALRRGDGKAAKQFAEQLLNSAKAVVIDRSLVAGRLAELEGMFKRHNIREPKLRAMLGDARAELAARRFESANAVCNHLLSSAFDVIEP